MIKKTYFYKEIITVLGNLKLIGSEDGLRAVLWENETDRIKLPDTMIENQSYQLFLETEKQLNEYFCGNRKEFSIKLDLSNATDFQKTAWEALLTIPYGKTRSYSEQAKLINKPNSVRAIGNANGKNPIPIIIPCHRLIAKNGNLTAFAGGLERKKFLIDLEKKNKSDMV